MSDGEGLQVKIFVCRNALGGGLRGGALRGLWLQEAVNVEQIPCLGKVDPRYLLRDFEAGCDAVCLIGCPVGKCRTMDGNLRAVKRAAFVRGVLEEVGIKGERVFVFLREAMDELGAKEVAGEFIRGVRALGPSELKKESGAKSSRRESSARR